jgi:uncharacterized protein (TIGR02646 family)
MRYIDLESHKPDDAWLKKSDELTKRLIELHEKGDIEARNKLIDDNKAHWGEIKGWLLDLSYNKCWFSEARDIFSHMDVEHFRPKVEAKDLDGTTRDGYWWLAFDYRNFRACGNVGNRKKGGWFPLQAGSVVSTFEHQCEESETRYLLDPTDADDVDLIAFDEEGKAIPAPGITEWEVQRVEETIRCLKLNEHEALPQERQKVWQRVALEIEKFQRAKSRCGVGGNPAAKQKASEHARNIRAMTRESEELSAVAKWCVLFRNDDKLSRLVA